LKQTGGDNTYRRRYEPQQKLKRDTGKIRGVTDDAAKDTVGEGPIELIGGTGKFANAKGSARGVPAKVSRQSSSALIIE
jgi:hypothetical protein